MYEKRRQIVNIMESNSSVLKKLIVILPIAAGIMWGSVGIFLRKLTDFGLTNASILQARMLIGILLLLIWILLKDKKLLVIKKKDIGLVLAGGLLGNLGLSYFYNEAMKHLTLSFAAVLLSTFPIFVMFMSAILFKEKITSRKLCCMALAITGCVLVSGILESSGGLQWTWYGLAVGIISSFCYALYSIFSKLVTDRGYSSMTVTFYFMLIIAVVMIPFTDWHSLLDYVGAAPAANTVFLVVHSLVTAVLPYVLYSAGLTYMDAGKAAILASLEPVAATFFGVTFFDEYPSLLAVAGMMLTVIAISLLCMPDRKAERKAASKS